MVNLAALFLKKYQEHAVLLGWQQDKLQQSLLEKLGNLYQNRFEESQESFWRRLFKSGSAVGGVYLYGPVGRGKTVLMDIVSEALPTFKKKRWHFTEFMQEVHSLIEKLSHSNGKDQPIIQAINSLRKEYDFIFLDELEVTEIADAMILGRLFKGLSEKGVLVFLTSNNAPEQLYKGGLHYDRFFPFVEYIKSVFQVLSLENEMQSDFRLLGKPIIRNTWLLQQLRQRFDEYVSQEGLKPRSMEINQRLLHFKEATQTAVWLDFSELGEKAYGAVDYQLIAQSFPTVFLVNVPQFTKENKDQARRFITLIDCLYDQKVKLYLHSQIDLALLYQPDPHNNLPFARTLSRLTEMQS